MRKEIHLGYGLYKYVDVKEELKPEEVEWKIVETEGGGFIRRPFKIQTESIKLQDELEPIFHEKKFKKDCPECADREADEILTGQAFSGLPFSSYRTDSQKKFLDFVDELKPIIHTLGKSINATHPTQHDESDDIEEAKSEEMTEFEKAEYKRKIAGVKKRRVWGEHPDQDFLDRIEKYYFSKGEKWEHKYDS
jgi:hypothetical protein